MIPTQVYSAMLHLDPEPRTNETPGKYYLLTSADHNTLQINNINSDGSVGSKVSALSMYSLFNFFVLSLYLPKITLAGGGYEAPGMFKVNGYYYLIVSAKTGWRANPNKVFYVKNLGDKWLGGTDIAPEDKVTYNSQNTFELTIKGSEKTTYIYMGDDWDKTGSAASNYVWLPMTVDSR